MRALALTTPKRSPQLPNVPTLIEVGLKGFDMTNWYGSWRPAKTPRDAVMKVNAEATSPHGAAGCGVEARRSRHELDPGTPEKFAAFLHSEIAKYAKLVKAANVTLETMTARWIRC